MLIPMISSPFPDDFPSLGPWKLYRMVVLTVRKKFRRTVVTVRLAMKNTTQSRAGPPRMCSAALIGETCPPSTRLLLSACRVVRWVVKCAPKAPMTLPLVAAVTPAATTPVLPSTNRIPVSWLPRTLREKLVGTTMVVQILPWCSTLCVLFLLVMMWISFSCLLLLIRWAKRWSQVARLLL